MGTEENISKQIREYQELGRQNKNIDVAALAMTAMAQARQEETGRRKKRWAYLVSIGLPPLGLLCAAYYAFGSKPDGKRIAINCIILTAAALLLTWFVGKLFFDSLGGADVSSQLQDVKIDDLRRLFQE